MKLLRLVSVSKSAEEWTEVLEQPLQQMTANN